MTRHKSLSIHLPVKVILFLAIIFGSFFRLFHIETKMRFIWDEGRDMLAIREMIVQHDLRLIGPMNEMNGRQDFFGVFHYYLMAPSLWLFGFNPVGPALFTAGLGILSILLVYFVVKQWFSPQIAAYSALLYAVNPLVTKYQQWPWNPNTTPFFGLLFILVVQKCFSSKAVIWSGVAGVLLGLLFQLHYFTIFLGGFWLVYWLDFPTWKRKIQHMFAFGFGFGAANVSFILFELRHNFLLTSIIRQSFVAGSRQQSFSFSPLQFVQTPVVAVGEVVQKIFFNSVISTTMSIALGCGLITFLIFRLVKVRKITSRRWEFGAILSLLTFLAAVGISPTLVDDYYFAPFIFLMLTAVVVLVSKIKSSVIRVLLYSGIVLVSMYTQHVFRAPTWEENMPKIRALSQIVAKDARTLKTTFNVAGFTDSDTKAKRYRYFIDVFGAKSEGFDDYEKTPVLYVITDTPWNKLRERNVWEINSFKEAQSTLLGSVDTIEVYRLNRELPVH